MGLVTSLLRGKAKTDAYHSDALILRETNSEGLEQEKILHFIIIPEKKRDQYSLLLVDGDVSRPLETQLTLDQALDRMRRRFLLKQEALGTAAQTRGGKVVIDNNRRPSVYAYNWLPTKEIFNFVASDIIDGPIH